MVKISVKNKKVYADDALVGLVIDNENVLLDTVRYRKVWHSQKPIRDLGFQQVWFYGISDKQANMEYVGFISPKTFTTFTGNLFKPIFVDDKVAIIERVVIPVEYLDLVMSPVFLQSTFLVYPRLIVHEVGDQQNVDYPVHINVIYPTVMFVEKDVKPVNIWGTCGRSYSDGLVYASREREYEIVDTGIEVLNFVTESGRFLMEFIVKSEMF